MSAFTRGIYTLLLALMLPALMWKLSRRHVQQGESKISNRFRQRFAFNLPPLAQGGIIFHCASVGETLAAAQLIKRYIDQHPNTPVILSSTSASVVPIIAQRFGDRVTHLYLPFDLPGCVNRFLRHFRPKLLVIMETEIWPNLCHACQKQGIPMLLLNARLSNKSRRSYQKFAALSRAMMNQFHTLACQSQNDADNFIKLGVDKNKVAVMGNMKFDIAAEPDCQIKAQEISRTRLGSRPAWLAASTHPGEDEILLAVHKKLLGKYPQLILLLAPRHPHRSAEVDALVAKANLFSATHTSGRALENDDAVYIVDTVGELMTFFALAELCFIGGSLIAHGGHNPLEPAALSKAIISGRQVHNFSRIYQEMENCAAVLFADNSEEIFTQVDNLLSDKERAKQYGERAFAYLQQHQGAIEKSLGLLNSFS